jgi:putative DNA primase/helicase
MTPSNDDWLPDPKDDLARIRETFAQPEDIDLPEDLQGRVGQGGDLPPPPAPPVEDGDEEKKRRVKDAADQPLNDFGNGNRFRIHFGEDLRSVAKFGWFVWNGKVWAFDQAGIQVRGKAQKVAALIEAETSLIQVPPAKADLVAQHETIAGRIEVLKKIKDRSSDQEAEYSDLLLKRDEITELLGKVQDRIGQRLRHAKNAGNSGPITNMIAEAAVMLDTPLDILDASALDVNTQSGVLRFSVMDGREGGASRTAMVELVPHHRDQLLTKIMPVAYDPSATCPGFDKFLARIQPEADMRRFLQRVFGLAMTGITGDQMLCFFYGTGANGKSVLVDLIARILGDYAATAKIESLTGTNRRGGGDATPDLVPLIGSRFVRAAEPDEGVRWQEGLIKDLTGGEPILVRALHSDFVSVRPQFKLVISGNHKPDIRGTDDGIWRRLKLVPFEETIPKPDRIPKNELDELLFAEAPGILNWMVAGLIDYLEGGLQEPTKVMIATEEFREESDPLGGFLGRCTVVTGRPEHRISSKDLIEAFNFWRASDGLPEWGGAGLAKKISAKAGKWRHPQTGLMFDKVKSNGSTVYSGLRFTDFFQRALSDAPRDNRGKLRGVSYGEDEA